RIGPGYGFFAPFRKIKCGNNVPDSGLIGKFAGICLDRLWLLHGSGDRGRIRNSFFDAHTTHGATGEREETYAKRGLAQSICVTAQSPEIIFVASRIDSQRYSLVLHAKDAGIMGELELTSGVLGR